MGLSTLYHRMTGAADLSDLNLLTATVTAMSRAIIKKNQESLLGYPIFRLRMRSKHGRTQSAKRAMSVGKCRKVSSSLRMIRYDVFSRS